MFSWNSLAFPMIQWMLAIWSLVPLPFLHPDWTSGSSQFTYCWRLAWGILSVTLLACEMSATVRYFEHSLVLPFFRIGMKTDLFWSCGHFWVFPICWHVECSTFNRSHRQKNKCKKAKWLSEEALQIAMKRREAKGKGEKERYSVWMQSPKEQQGEIRKPSSVASAKK